MWTLGELQAEIASYQARFPVEETKSSYPKIQNEDSIYNEENFFKIVQCKQVELGNYQEMTVRIQK